MSKKSVKFLLSEFERNAKWFTEHYAELSEKYEGKLVAMRGRKVVAVSESIDELIEELERRGEDISLIYIGAVPPRGLAFIM